MTAFAKVALSVGLLTCSVARLVSAAPCGRPDVDVTFPHAQALGVPSNAELSAHYGSPALYDEEPVALTDAQGSDIPVDVRFDEIESMLYAKPTSALTEGEHQLTWPGLRSVSTGGVGLGRTLGFTVTSNDDRAAPTFSGLEALEWDLSRDRDPCLDRLDDRFAFQLFLGSTSDDAPVDLLQVRVFETRTPGAGSSAGPSQVALRALPAGGVLEVRRPAAQAGETCFAAIVSDLVGQASGGGEREVCVVTKKPPFFEGCAFSHASSGDSAVWLLAVLGFLAYRRGSAVAPRRAVR